MPPKGCNGADQSHLVVLKGLLRFGRRYSRDPEVMIASFSKASGGLRRVYAAEARGWHRRWNVEEPAHLSAACFCELLHLPDVVQETPTDYRISHRL